jgi:hypothetical protein
MQCGFSSQSFVSLVVKDFRGSLGRRINQPNPQKINPAAAPEAGIVMTQATQSAAPFPTARPSSDGSLQLQSSLRQTCA